MKIAYNDTATETAEGHLRALIGFNVLLTHGKDFHVEGTLKSVTYSSRGFLTLGISHSLPGSRNGEVAEYAMRYPVGDPAMFTWCSVQVLVY